MKIVLFGEAKDRLPFQIDRVPVKNLKRVITYRWPTMSTKKGLPISIYGDEHYHKEKIFIHLYYKQTPSRIKSKNKLVIDDKTSIDAYINNPILQFRYEYSEDYHLKRMDYYNAKWPSTQYYKYITDADGHILSQVHYANDGKLIKKYEYEFEFDSFGNPVKITNKANAAIFTENEYAYSESNILMKRFLVKHGNREQISETEYRYTNSDKGRIVIIKHSDLRTKTQTETYKVFDLFNNLTEKSLSRGNRLISHSLSTFEYDVNNNWVSSRTRFTGYRLVDKESLTTREIEYN